MEEFQTVRYTRALTRVMITYIQYPVTHQLNVDYVISAITEQVTQTSTKSAKMEIEQAIDIKCCFKYTVS